jgi:hypothetical protein
MADYHQIADQIRAFVQSNDQTRTSSLDHLATAYVESCIEVNQRMGRCHRLLQQGLRSEAIQLAESAPRLLDAVAALDFPERADWDELLQIYELPVAPKVAINHAQFLNEAYAQEDPLQDLLRTHRRLALQRAPIRSRIEVMRKLAAQDSNNPIWTDDLRIFEKARFHQIQSDAVQAAQNRNLPALTTLVAEIDQQTWVEPPPKALVNGLRKADAQLRGQQTRAALTELETRLNDAFTARDPIQGRLARQAWITLTTEAAISRKDAIWDRVGGALHWLDEQDRIADEDRAHEDAVNTLVSALDEPAYVPPAELERLAHAVLQFGRGMSERIQVRYVARLRSAETAHTLRWRMVGGAAAAAILIVASLGFYLIRSWRRSTDAAEAATAVLDMIRLGQIEQANSFVAKLGKADEGLLSFPQMLEARERLQVLRDKETERILEFDRAIHAAMKVPLTKVRSSEIETARELARLPAENQAIEQLLNRRAADLKVEQAKHEKAVAPRLEAVGAQLAEIQRKLDAEKSANTDDSELQAAVADAHRVLLDLESELPYVGDPLQSLAAALTEKVETVRSRLDKRRKQIRIEDEITAAIAFLPTTKNGDFVVFADGLGRYIKLAPDDPRSIAFQKTRDEQPLWHAAEAWAALASSWKRQPDGLAAQEARLRAQVCSQFLIQHPNVPGRDEIARYQKSLEAIARRAPGNNSPTTNLRRLFSDVLVENVWMVTTHDGNDLRNKAIVRHYYSRKQPAEGDDPMRFNAMVSFDGKVLARLIAKDRITYLGLSPQSKIAEQFAPKFANESKLRDWESVMISLVDAILKSPDFDPTLEVAMLRQVVESAMEGSEPLLTTFATTKNLLDAVNVDINVPWMDPQTPRPDPQKIGQLIQSIRASLKPLGEVLAEREEIERAATRVYRSVGWLRRNAETWQLRHGVALPRDGNLWVVVLPEGRRSEWRKVGAITNGKPKIDDRDQSSLSEGRPVFVILSPQ